MSRSRLFRRALVLVLAATGALVSPGSVGSASAAPASCVMSYAAAGLKMIQPRPTPPPPPAPQGTYSVGWVDFQVPDTRAVLDVDFGFDVTATDASGLAFALDGPQSVSGNPRSIAEDASGQISGSFTIDDEATGPFARVAPPSGRYRPKRAASELDGSSAAGRWRLFITNTSEVSGSWGNATLTLTVDCDLDKDGVADDSDNCPAAANPDQAASDDDSLGDACDLDLDGDSHVNSSDGCPSVAAGTASGCPSAGRTARLRYSAKAKRLTITVRSDVAGCRDRAEATLLRVTKGKDAKVLVATTGAGGRTRVKAPKRSGRYYVTVARSYAAGEAECDSARSGRQRVARKATLGARAAVADTDGDGLDDSIDGCPTVASGNPTGCPTASRKVSLKWLPGKRRLEARVTSPVNACAARARIKLFLDRRSGPDKLLASDASYQGRRRFKVPGGARYYVMVTPTYSTGIAECGKAVSRTVRVPR